MKLYLRHIRRSLRSSALEPILILLTLSISIAALIMAVAVATNMLRDQNDYVGDNNLIGDITVKCSSSDNVRLLFDFDVEEVVGDRGVVLGQFSLGATVKNEHPVNEEEESENTEEEEATPKRRIEICATDLEKADRFRKMSFVEYGSFTEENINSSIVIHEGLANEYGLSVGDVLSVELLGKPFDFTVEAIVVKEGILWRHEAMISMSAVRMALAEENPLINSLSDNLTPYTLVSVEVFDDGNIQTILDELSADEKFKDKIIVNMSENVGGIEFYSILTLTATVATSGLVIVLAAAVIATSLTILEKKRRRESALFMLSGADRADLRKFLLMECGVYALLSVIPGCILSLPTLSFMNGIFTFNTGDLKFNIGSFAVAALGAPLILMTTALIHSLRSKHLTVSELMSEGESSEAVSLKGKTNLLLLFALALGFTVTLILPVRMRYIGVVPTVLILTFFSYCAAPVIIMGISNAASALLKKSKKIPAKLYLALRNVFASYPLMHTARLLTVLLVILGGMFSITYTLGKQVEVINGIVDCEYIAADADEKCEASVLELEATEDVFRMAFFNQMLCEDGSMVFAVSLDEADRHRINEQIRPARSPEKGEIVLPIGVAIYEGVRVGDSINVEYETNQYTFTVIEIIDTTPNLAFIDEESIGANKNMLCINTADTERETEIILDDVLKLRGVGLVSRVDLFSTYTGTVNSYASLLEFITVIAAVTTLAGIASVIHSARLERENESRICYVLGMTEGEVGGLRILELLVALLFAVVIAIPFFLGFAALVDMATNSFGVDLIH